MSAAACSSEPLQNKIHSLIVFLSSRLRVLSNGELISLQLIRKSSCGPMGPSRPDGLALSAWRPSFTLQCLLLSNPTHSMFFFCVFFFFNLHPARRGFPLKEPSNQPDLDSFFFGQLHSVRVILAPKSATGAVSAWGLSQVSMLQNVTETWTAGVSLPPRPLRRVW